MKIITPLASFEADNIEDIKKLIDIYKEELKSKSTAQDSSDSDSEENRLANEYQEVEGTRFRLQSKFSEGGDSRLDQLRYWKSKQLEDTKSKYSVIG